MVRKLGFVLLFLVGLVALSVAGAWVYAQTQTGRNQLATLIAGQLGEPGRPADVEGLGGQLPFDIRLGALCLRDEDGIWLEVEDARLTLRPAALLRGTVEVAEVGAGRVALHRLPVEQEPPKPFRLPQIPELPRSLPHVEIRNVHIDVLALGQPVLGEAATFALTGHGGTGSDGAGAGLDLALRRTDRSTAQLDLSIGVDLAAQTLRVDARGEETGGLLATATGHPEAGALRLSLTGDGPLADWKGRLELNAERLAQLQLAIDIAYAERRRLAMDGSLELAQGALSPDLGDLVGSRVELGLKAAETGPRRYALQQLRVDAGAGSLSGQGELDLAADKVAGEVTLAAPDLQPLSTVAAIPLAGSASLHLTAAGAASRPELTLTPEGRRLTAANLALARLGGSMGLSFTEPISSGRVGLRAKGSLSGDGLLVDGREIGDGHIMLALSGTLPAAGEATLEELALKSGLGEIAAQGRFDRDRLAGTGRLHLNVPDVSSAAKAGGAEIAVAGGIAFDSDVSVGDGLKRIEVDLKGGASDLTGLPPGAQELVGRAPTLAARAVIEPNVAATVERLELVGTGLRLEGNPRLGLGDHSLGGELRLTVPDLKLLHGALAQPIAGDLGLAVTLGGTLDVPQVGINGTANRFAVADQTLDRVTLTGSAAGPIQAPSGSVRLAATQAGQQIEVASDYRLAGETLNLTGLKATAPATKLSGNVDVVLKGPLARGSLAGEVSDLGALPPWLGPGLAGRVGLDLKLTTPQDRQDAALRVDLSGLAAGFGSLRQASLTATLTDLLGAIGIDAQLTAGKFSGPSAAVDQAKLGLRGRLAALDLSASAAGNQAGKPFDVAVASALDLSGPRRTIRIGSITGKFAGQPISLAKPATVVLADGGMDLDSLDLRLGPGQVTGSLALGASRVQGELVLTPLPLKSLEPFGVPPMGGTAGARVTLAGNRAAPELTMRGTVADVAVDRAAKSKVNGSLNAQVAGGRLQSDLALTGLGSEPLTAQASLPVTFNLDPGAFALAANASLSGHLAGPIDLARLARFIVLDGTQVSGVLSTGLDLSGTLQNPRLDGTATLDKGVVQDLATGLNLREVTLHAQAQGDRLAIETLQATDQAGGKFSGQGAVRLLAGGGIGYDLSAKAGRARVLDNTLGVVVLSGDASVTGTLAKALARGAFTVDSADLQIPNSLGPSVPTIKVREVRDGSPVIQSAAPSTPFDLGFDVKVDIPGRFFVRGRGLDSEWTGKLSLKGDLADPLIEGELDVRRGRLDLLDRRFNIDRGAIDFVGSRPPIPMIDLAATATTAEVTVTVAIQGPAADPKIKLSSEPTLPQDEILSRLLFGTSVAKITPMQGLRLAAAVNDLQGDGFVTSTLTKLRRAVGLDTIDVESTESTDQNGETTQQTNAKVGKYITDKVYLEAQRGVTDGTNKARVKVDLTPNLSVGSSVTDQAQTGVGIQWRYDY